MRLFVVFAIAAGCLGCAHPWFKSGSQRPHDQQPELVAPREASAHRGGYSGEVPRWRSLIDACMQNGGGRHDCIHSLAPDERAEFEQWEREQAEKRRALFLRRQQQLPGVKR